MNGSPECGIPRPRWGPLFVSLPLLHRSVRVVVLFLVFFRRSLLNQVVWDGACARLNKRNLHPDGQTLTQLATSVHIWWNACLLMQIFIQDLSNLFNMHLCFLFFVTLKSPFFLLNIQASWCQTCWFGVNGFIFLRSGRGFSVWILIWQTHHAECWDPSVCEGGRVSRVFTSKSRHLEKNVLGFYSVAL